MSDQPHPIVDDTTSSALLAVFIAAIYTRAALTDTDTQQLLFGTVAVALALVIAARDPHRPFRLPTTPTALHPYAQEPRRPYVRAAVITGAVVMLSLLVRIIDLAATTIWPYSDALSYNDPTITGRSTLIDLGELLGGAVGEELLFRVALLAVARRYLGTPTAIALTTVTWALSHTGFERGYGAATVIGLAAVGIVYAAATIATRSIWPAVIAHTIHNLGVVIEQRHLPILWLVPAIYGVGAIAFGVAFGTIISTWRHTRTTTPTDE